MIPFNSPDRLLFAAFLVLLAIATTVRVWLALRHIRHVAAHSQRVPEAFDGQISIDAHRKAADYTVAKTRFGISEILLGTAVVLLFTVGGLLQWLSEAWATVVEPDGYAYGIFLILSVAVISGLLEIPFSLYRTFVIEVRFGFNRTTLAVYFGDLIKQTALGAALGVPLLLGVLWLMARMGDLWWLWVWGAWMAFNLLVLTLYPTLIAPLFNRFSPLENPELRDGIDALLERCGFRSRGLFVMDGSRRSSHGNAYFTGFGAGRRIVLFDTLISRLERREIEAVLAHELGHFARRHILKRIAMLFSASLLLLGILGMVIDQPWFFSAFGVQSSSTAMALLLFLMVIPVFTFPFQPLASLYSRRHEYEADAYAAAHADARDLVHALVKLYRDNASTLTPDPLHSAFHDSHPPASLRVERLLALPARQA